MTKRSLAAFTLVEMLVVIAIIATIAAFALPAITGALTRGQLAQAVSNARQVHLATFAMTTDGTQTGDAKYAWPGDLKVFAAPGITPWNGSYTKPADANSKGAFSPQFDGDKNCAFKIYKVTDKDPGNAIFLATKNFSYSSNSNTAINSTATTPAA